MINLYLQFGTVGTPMQTVKVPHKIKELDCHRFNLLQTATGYGSKLATRYMIKYFNRWYRVYSKCFSNTSCEYVIMKGQQILVTTYEGE